jgi:uncharacterized protein YbjT (DUF2867 family)
MRDPQGPILIIGGTGKTGRRVAARLAELGIPTRLASRSGPTRFDWDDVDTYADALRGTSAAYVTYAPDLAVPGAPAHIRTLAHMAEEQGVGRLVLLSGRGEEEAQRCERIVLETNQSWTVIRASWFSQNFSESFFLEPLQQGVLALPAGDVREPFVDAEDIADVAVAALTQPGHEGQIYEVTGPRLLSFAEAVGEIGKASGRPLRYEQIPLDAFTQGMRDESTPESLVALTRYLFETVLDGRNAEVTDGVQRAISRAPRDFSAYASAASATGIWREAAPLQTATVEERR